MNTPSEIYAPNIRLFAYHLATGTFTDFQRIIIIDSQIQAFYNQLLANYQFKINFRSDKPPLPKYDLLDKKSQNRRTQTLPLTPLETFSIKGFAYPQLINDTYAFALTLYHPQKADSDRVTFDQLPQFNPQNCLLIQHPEEPELAQSFWGQTLFISGFIGSKKPASPKDLQPLAQNCLQEFLKQNNLEQCPPYYRQGELFNGYIYEYGNPRLDCSLGHILILFIFEESTTEILKRCQWDLPELFLYYHKNSQNFQDSRIEYREAIDQIKTIETTLINFNKTYPKDRLHALTSSELQNLKTELKTLLNIALQYSQHLRNLEYFHNTITINTGNYRDTLQRIENAAESDVTFWMNFADKECQKFLQQIEADLNYLRQGSGLLDTAIATIRGLVEIEQAERDRSLERTIQILGAGLGAGGIVASAISGHIQTPRTLPQVNLILNPPILALLWSLSAGLTVGVIVALLNGAIAPKITRCFQKNNRSAIAPTSPPLPLPQPTQLEERERG